MREAVHRLMKPIKILKTRMTPKQFIKIFSLQEATYRTSLLPKCFWVQGKLKYLLRWSRGWKKYEVKEEKVKIEVYQKIMNQLLMRMTIHTGSRKTDTSQFMNRKWKSYWLIRPQRSWDSRTSKERSSSDQQAVSNSLAFRSWVYTTRRRAQDARRNSCKQIRR